MIKIQITSRNEYETNISLSGNMGEDLDFDGALGTLTPHLNVSCEKIRYLNSVGVKRWIGFFVRIRKENIKVRFKDCAISIVSQANINAHFIHLDELESICLPYLCVPCNREETTIKPITELLTFHQNTENKITPPKAHCPRCSSVMSFDEEPEEYFRLLFAPHP